VFCSASALDDEYDVTITSSRSSSVGAVLDCWTLPDSVPSSAHQ